MLDGCRFSDMTLKGTIEFADCDLIDPWFGGIDRARVMFSGKSYIDGKVYQGALGGAGQG
jgi:hypothetical protein